MALAAEPCTVHGFQVENYRASNLFLLGTRHLLLKNSLNSPGPCSSASDGKEADPLDLALLIAYSN